VEDEIQGQGEIWFIGEHPAGEEARQGRPFVGKSGQLLRKLLRDAEINDFVLTNLVKCVPPQDISPQNLKMAQQLCTRHLLIPSLAKAKKVVALGQLATQILKWCGVDAISAPHPAAVLRNPTLLPKLEATLKNLNITHSFSAHVDFTIVTPDKVQDLEKHLHRVQYFVVDFEVGGDHPYDPKSPVLCAAIATSDLSYYLLPFKDHGVDAYREALRVVSRGNWVAHNAIFEALWLYRITGVIPRRPYADTMLMYYALDESAQGFYDLKYLAKTFLGAPEWDKEIEPYIENHSLEFCPTKILYNYCVKDAYWTLMLYRRLVKELETPENLSLNSLLKNLLYPAVILYALATHEGMMIDKKRCEEVRQTLTGHIEQIKERLEKFAPSVNFSSPQQLAALLYEKWKLPHLQVTATGQPSTNEETLKMLLEWCEKEGKQAEATFLRLLFQYRELTKMVSTYVDGVLEYVCSDGCVRPSWKLHGTVSGRVTCSKPSLQQIPARSDHTNFIRSIFVPKEGHVFIEVDFSNHELRVAASLAKDEHAREIFASGRDIHREVAAKIFNKDPQDVTSEERQIAKSINFGILYGMSPSTLAATLRITDAEAQMFFNGFYELFPKVREWQQRLIRDAKIKGYVETPTGRRRRLPEIKESDPAKQSKAIRQALNSPVQSYASDLCLMTAILWAQRALSKGMKARVVLTIHDSILIHAPREEIPLVLTLLDEAIKEVERNENLFVPLEVEVAVMEGCWRKEEKRPLRDVIAELACVKCDP